MNSGSSIHYYEIKLQRRILVLILQCAISHLVYPCTKFQNMIMNIPIISRQITCLVYLSLVIPFPKPWSVDMFSPFVVLFPRYFSSPIYSLMGFIILCYFLNMDAIIHSYLILSSWVSQICIYRASQHHHILGVDTKTR